MVARALTTIAAVSLGVIAGCSALGDQAGPDPTPTTPAPTAEQRPTQEVLAPNIVVFMTDDQTIDEMVALPKVQRDLFDEGMTFTQSFVNLPSCCPSRATFLTGQHAVNHGVLTNQGVSGGFDSFKNQDATLPTSLAAAGYQTIFVGKYLNGFGLTTSSRYTPPGWTDFRGLVAPTETLYHSASFWVNGELVSYSEDEYTTDAVTEMAIDAIALAAETEQPLFATVSYPAPHAQSGAALGDFNLLELQRQAANVTDLSFLQAAIPAPRDVGSYAGAQPQASPSVNEFDIADKPQFLHRRLRGSDEFEPVQKFYQAALESLQAVDQSVIDIMSLLEQSSPDRETWFLFTSDNGLLLGEHRHFGVKYFPYEENVRVPLAIRGPGIEAGFMTPAVVSNVDLTPTIVDIAGATLPRETDGRSLLPLLLGQEEPSGRAILIQGFEFRPSSPPYKAVHTGDSIYVEWLTGELELYDLVKDPFQLENLAGQAPAAGLQRRNEKLLRQLEGCAGSTCAKVGSDLAPPAHPTRSRQ